MKTLYACTACEFASSYAPLPGVGHAPQRDGEAASCFPDCPGELRAWDVSGTGKTLHGQHALFLVERDTADTEAET